ncbi:MAG: hypothetical protein HQL12_07615 [Candidatus Omnitrophica bacterium]|nr:hypothetical protein [Candidatus Omnitrophota bacterium]
MRTPVDHSSSRGQTGLEYLLLLAVVAVVVITGFGPGSLVDKVHNAATGYYNSVTNVIMGNNPQKIDGGWCPVTCPPQGNKGFDVMYGACECPAPAFGGKNCPAGNVTCGPGQTCKGQIVDCSGSASCHVSCSGNCCPTDKDVCYNGNCCTPKIPANCVAASYTDDCGLTIASNCQSPNVCYNDNCCQPDTPKACIAASYTNNCGQSIPANCTGNSICFNDQCCMPNNNVCNTSAWINNCGQSQSANCLAGHNCSGPQGCVPNVCSALTIPAGAIDCNNSALPASNNASFTLSQSCDGTTSCQAQCDTYHHYSSGSCAANQCAALPAHASACANAPLPTQDGAASVLAADCNNPVACQAQCAINYHYLNGSCAQDQCAASSLPANAAACSGAPLPTQDGALYVLKADCSNPVACQANCDSTHHYSNGACVANQCQSLPNNFNGGYCPTEPLPTKDQEAYSLKSNCTNPAACQAICNFRYHIDAKNPNSCAANQCINLPSHATSCSNTSPIQDQTAYFLAGDCNNPSDCQAECGLGFAFNATSKQCECGGQDEPCCSSTTQCNNSGSVCSSISNTCKDQCSSFKEIKDNLTASLQSIAAAQNAYKTFNGHYCTSNCADLGSINKSLSLNITGIAGFSYSCNPACGSFSSCTILGSGTTDNTKVYVCAVTLPLGKQPSIGVDQTGALTLNCGGELACGQATPLPDVGDGCFSTANACGVNRTDMGHTFDCNSCCSAASACGDAGQTCCSGNCNAGNTCISGTCQPNSCLADTTVSTTCGNATFGAGTASGQTATYSCSSITPSCGSGPCCAGGNISAQCASGQWTNNPNCCFLVEQMKNGHDTFDSQGNAFCGDHSYCTAWDSKGNCTSLYWIGFDATGDTLKNVCQGLYGSNADIYQVIWHEGGLSELIQYDGKTCSSQTSGVGNAKHAEGFTCAVYSPGCAHPAPLVHETRCGGGTWGSACCDGSTCDTGYVCDTNINKCQTNLCQGALPLNATECANNTSAANSTTPFTLVSSCPTIPAACQAECSPGYYFDGSACQLDSCQGLPANSQPCGNNSQPSNNTTSYTLVNPCPATPTPCQAECDSASTFTGSGSGAYCKPNPVCGLSGNQCCSSGPGCSISGTTCINYNGNNTCCGETLVSFTAAPVVANKTVCGNPGESPPNCIGLLCAGNTGFTVQSHAFDTPPGAGCADSATSGTCLVKLYSCSGATTSCGGGAPTQACCAPSTSNGGCNSNFSCVAGNCFCGGSGQECCAGSVCGAGTCLATGLCPPCGEGVGQICCAGNTCDVSAGLACNTSTGKCATCGGKGQLCCSSVCATGLECSTPGNLCCQPSCSGKCSTTTYADSCGLITCSSNCSSPKKCIRGRCS